MNLGQNELFMGQIMNFHLKSVRICYKRNFLLNAFKITYILQLIQQKGMF
uniref:Uncharacterized protein n=1 Tax=Meloidogyne enterolobii TaxID=390850 RepID=A0A6V7W032_MELEN|nr:unnamed protein product [Meloidogyne enterolobii]